ncbi:MAG: hypothetical protein KKE20_03210 [Nanoarchaeota archaeon]|nr:hypothetical protein [Nanoarchaeota archaeon]
MEIRELLRLFNLLFSKIREMYGYFNVSQPGISFALEKEIAKELEKMGISGLKQHEILEKLLIQEGATLVEEEESGLLDLAMIIRKNNALKQLFENEDEHILKELPRMSRTIGSVRSFNDKLDLHILRYSYLASYEDFDLFYKKYYINRIKHIIDFEDHILDKKKKALFPVKKEVEEARNKVYEENKIPKHLRHLINVAGYYSHQRMHIRTYFVKGVSVLGRFYDEFAHRMNIGPREARYLMNEEINAFFLENKPVDKQEVLKRMQLSIYRIKDDVPALFAGKEAEEFEEKYLPKEDLDVTELKGTIANKGYKKGRVKVLELGKNIAKQIDEMKRGDILVAGNTRPEVIVACQKASAIVTDEGGILSHAALVSREFGIPCIVSTYKATRVFKTGDLVEVDANNGVVRKL